MIDHVSAGEPLQIRAEDYNLIADVANDYASAGGIVPTSAGVGYNRGQSNNIIYGVYTSKANKGYYVHFTTPKVTPAKTETNIYVQISGNYTGVNQYDPIAIVLQDTPAGQPVPLAIGGMVYAQIASWDNTKQYARPFTQYTYPSYRLEATDQPSPLKIIGDVINGWGLVCWDNNFRRGIGSSQIQGRVYEVGRTYGFVYNDRWDPPQNIPNDWQTYQYVKVYYYAQALAATEMVAPHGGNYYALKHHTIIQTWPANMAPIIHYSDDWDASEFGRPIYYHALSAFDADCCDN